MGERTEIVNGRITHTELGPVENGIFTFYITIEMGSCGVKLGGYRLDEFNKDEHTCKGTAYGMNVIMQTLKVVGVDCWEDLVGEYVRVERHGLGETISKIGNIIEDEWIDYKTFGDGLPIKSDSESTNLDVEAKQWIKKYNTDHLDHHDRIWVIDRVSDGVHPTSCDITDNLSIAFTAGYELAKKTLKTKV